MPERGRLQHLRPQRTGRSAYVFARTGELWTQQAKLTAADSAADDWFGCGVALDAETAVVGAVFDDDGSGNSGSAYVFTHLGGVWTQHSELTASDAAPDDYFGFAVAVDHDAVMVGAHLDDPSGQSAAGLVYYFAPEFEITEGGGPFTLGPNESRTVGVQFCCDDGRPKSATLRIESNDPEENPCDIELAGTCLTFLIGEPCTPISRNQSAAA